MTLALVVPCKNEYRRLDPSAFLDAIRAFPWLTFLFVDTAVHLVLNTLWLYLLYGKGVAALLASRVPKIVLCYPLRVAMFLIVSRPLLQFAAGRR